MCSFGPDTDEAVTPQRFAQAQLLLDAFRLASTTGNPSTINEPAITMALLTLKLEGVSLKSTQLLEDIRAWLLQRVRKLACQYDPRIRRECIEIRRLAFFYHYYLTQPASYREICSLKPSPKTRIPSINSLLDWWASTTGSTLTDLPPLPRHIKPEQHIIDDLVPIASRSVGDNIRAATGLMFDAYLGRSVKPLCTTVPTDRMNDVDLQENSVDLFPAVCRMLTKQWAAPIPHIVTEVDVERLAQAQRCLIVGEAGSGKSTLLRRVAQRICYRDRGNAVLIDLHNTTLWGYLDQPAALIFSALFGRVSEEQCEKHLASGDLVVLFDHPEAVSEADIEKLIAAVSSLPRAFLAVPEWMTLSFPNAKHYTLPAPSADLVKQYLPQQALPSFLRSLIKTPRGLTYIAERMQKGEPIDATAALLTFIEHAGLNASRRHLLLFCQQIAVNLAMQAKPIDACFVLDSMELGEWQEFSKNCRLLLRAGLLRMCDAGCQIAHPELVRASLSDSWISVATSMASPLTSKQVITAGRSLAETADQYVSHILPSLVTAVEQILLPPQQVLEAMVDLPVEHLQQHRETVEQMMMQLDKSWQHLDPNDSQRLASMRAARFHLRRHASPRVSKPSEMVKREVAGLLNHSEASFDRVKTWEAVCLADASSDTDAAGLILAYFDSQPECQADLLIGALKADSVSGFDLFCALLQRPTFSAFSSAGYVAGAFPDWANHFSISLLRDYVAEIHDEPNNDADRYIAMVANLMR